nr:ABC transporter permease [bacterium]
RELNDNGITVVLVTNEEEIGRQARRLIRMRDGKIISDERIGREPPPKRETAAGNVPRERQGGFGPSEIFSHFTQGFKTLAANKVRTALSMLGILIGVAAVVAMLALGQGAKQAIEKQLSSLGSNLLMLRSGAIRMGGVTMETGATTKLRLEDAAALKDGIIAISAVSPWVQGRAQVTFGNNNWSTTVMGTSPAFAHMRAAEPEIGRYFTHEENRARALVAVVGLTVARELFGDRNPVGELIKINRINFRVIGLLPEKGAAGPRDQDDAINIPISTAMYRLFGKDYVDAIDIEVGNADEIDAVQSDVMALMMSRHKVPPSQQQGAFQIRNMADIKEALTSSSKTMSLLLSAIAAISLVVGGIGIMNIMLVSVTERTREIGLRKAVGARRFDILSQFLAEAIVVSVVGGAAGVALGTLVTVTMTAVTGWTTSVSAASVLLAFFFSGSIGVIFGFYPARRAAALNPIDALRYE